MRAGGRLSQQQRERRCHQGDEQRRRQSRERRRPAYAAKPQMRHRRRESVAAVHEVVEIERPRDEQRDARTGDERIEATAARKRKQRQRKPGRGAEMNRESRQHRDTHARRRRADGHQHQERHTPHRDPHGVHRAARPSLPPAAHPIHNARPPTRGTGCACSDRALGAACGRRRASGAGGRPPPLRPTLQSAGGRTRQASWRRAASRRRVARRHAGAPRSSRQHRLPAKSAEIPDSRPGRTERVRILVFFFYYHNISKPSRHPKPGLNPRCRCGRTLRARGFAVASAQQARDMRGAHSPFGLPRGRAVWHNGTQLLAD